MPPGLCSGMSLTIRGKREPLLDGAGPLIRRLSSLR
jgi:hypothetical protein